MRVLHLVKTAVGAGWALRQIAELVQLGVRVDVALPEGPMVPRYRAAGATVHLGPPDLPFGRPLAVPGRLAHVRRLVDAIGPDVVHSHFFGTTLAMRLALRDRPVPRVFQVPGPLHLENPVSRAMDLRSADARDHWVGSCAWTCSAYRRAGVPPERISLAYYGDAATLVPRPPGKLRAELGLTPQHRVVGMVAYVYAPKRYVGQRRGLKGHEDLIDALALRDDPHTVGVFVGGPWAGAVAYERKVQAYAARRLGRRAVFLGTRSDVPDLYADFDVAVHPSHSENLGGAAESLGLGVPTIASDVGGLPDVVIDGQTGWLVPPRRPDAIARAIGEALADPVEARARAARGVIRVRELCDVRRNATALIELYERITKGGVR